MRSIALASVAVPTVERALAPIRCWSTMIAVVRPSSTSTSGRASVGMKPCTKALYVSLISRCDSAAMVPNTRELLPEPETPVNTVSRRLGSSTLMSLRLLTRAPCTRIRSWLSATCSAGDCLSVLVALLTGVLAPVIAPAVVVDGLDPRLAQHVQAGRVAVRLTVIDAGDVGVDDHLGAHHARRRADEHDLARELGAGLDQSVLLTVNATTVSWLV